MEYLNLNEDLRNKYIEEYKRLIQLGAEDKTIEVEYYRNEIIKIQENKHFIFTDALKDKYRTTRHYGGHETEICKALEHCRFKDDQTNKSIDIYNVKWFALNDYNQHFYCFDNLNNCIGVCTLSYDQIVRSRFFEFVPGNFKITCVNGKVEIEYIDTFFNEYWDSLPSYAQLIILMFVMHIIYNLCGGSDLPGHCVERDLYGCVEYSDD